MCVIYDNYKEVSIVCFKPDVRRGKYKQTSLVENDPDKKLIRCYVFRT